MTVRVGVRVTVRARVRVRVRRPYLQILSEAREQALGGQQQRARSYGRGGMSAQHCPCL